MTKDQRGGGGMTGDRREGGGVTGDRRGGGGVTGDRWAGAWWCNKEARRQARISSLPAGGGSTACPDLLLACEWRCDWRGGEGG